ncbi:zeta toxin family protein [Prosthecobacter dejongeii]|nr:zeta toxin family protein [Prosthecobacter dejongeii]
MFAGPNGSGKSTIKSLLPEKLLGVYLNPDEIEAGIIATGFLDTKAYGVKTSVEEILPFFARSVLLKKAGLDGEVCNLRFEDDKLIFKGVSVNAYFASVCADFLRQRLLESGVSFSFETVMSSPDKVALLQQAQIRGYKTYLYYIATDDPAINVARVKARVNLGGHDVPEDKIVSRYSRSLDLLLNAVRFTNRAYLFDNSRHGGDHLWVAEITEGQDLEIKCDPLPHWFQHSVWDKIQH